MEVKQLNQHVCLGALRGTGAPGGTNADTGRTTPQSPLTLESQPGSLLHHDNIEQTFFTY